MMVQCARKAFASRRSRIRRLLAVVLLQAALAGPATTAVVADGVDLLKLAEELNAVLEWNPVRQLGVLAAGDRRVALRVGTPWVLVDGTDPLFVGDVVRRAGAVEITSMGADELRRVLQEGNGPPVHRIGAILIDPGHGGKDPGAVATHQMDGRKVTMLEKDIVLETSIMLHRLLSVGFPDKKVILSRDEDRYLTLEERTALGNSLLDETGAAVIFISIHANASLSKMARGFEVWHLPEDHRRDVLPDSSAAKSRELAPILNSVQEEEFTRDSQLLAHTIIDHFQHRVGDRSINRGVHEESWFVVRNAKMPAVLVELGFATNKREAALLADPDYLRTLAEAIYSAVAAFVTTYEESDSR
jgi:N-acetylmuramoyl-L-alanine amidase